MNGGADRLHPEGPPPAGLSSGNTLAMCSASVTLPVYVFDCPLTELTNDLLAKGSTHKETICRDHTFKEDSGINASSGASCHSAEQAEQRSHSSPQNTSSSTIQTLSQYCAIIEALYCKCLGQALFTSLQQDKHIHSRDVASAMDLCKETLVEVDITDFIHNICGHIKDFKTKAGLETLLLRQQSGQPEESSQGKLQFPMSLLQLHQPCVNLKHLHKLIRTRFEEILCFSFKPIPTQPDYYFYCPPDHQVFGAAPSNNGLEINDISIGPDDNEVVEFRRSFNGPEDDTSHGSACSGSTGPMEDLDIDVDDDSEEEQPHIPLFLHLTATVRSGKDVSSHSLNSIPTCLGDLLPSLPGILISLIYIIERFFRLVTLFLRFFVPLESSEKVVLTQLISLMSFTQNQVL